ncbi:hypothetical protein LPJ75_005071, partial [Coemansia sp. RSA 2598]
MLVKGSRLALAAAVLAAAAFLPSAHSYEVDLEWEVSPATKGISTAISLLRFTNETSPPATEWVPLGWSYGSMSLQHRGDRSSFVSLQISPPSANHQVILGRTSDIADVKYQPTVEGPSQVFLEAKVDLDASQPYYFKVEAHHDLKQNRTTYEGLYSMGNHWLYMGSLILQHPNATDNARVLVSQAVSSDSAKKSASGSASGSAASADVSDPKSQEGSDSEAGSDSEGSDNESDGEKSSTAAAAASGGSSPARRGVRERITSSARRLDSGSRPSQESSDRDVDSNSDRDSDSDNDSDNDNDSDKDSDSDSEGDSDNDSGNDKEGRGNSAKSSQQPRSSAPAERASRKKKLKLFEMDSPMTMPGSQHSHHHSMAKDDSFESFVHAGFDAFRSHRLPHTATLSSAPATSVAAATRAAMVPAGAADDMALGLLKNGIEYPDFPVFPKIFSGIRRMDGGDPKMTRAGVYKKFQLRDRLGETLFISQGHAYSYDGADDDVASVRHFFMSASYLLSIDGAKLPSA